MWDAQPPPSSADVAKANAELATAKRGPGWPYGKRDITPTEAQKLVDAAKLLAKKGVAYEKHGRESDLQEADCTGAVGLIYDLAGMRYEGVGGANVAGNADFNSKFRQLGSNEKPQVGDIALWPNRHASMADPNAPPDLKNRESNAWSAYQWGTPFQPANIERMSGIHGQVVYYRYQVSGKP